MKILVVDDEKTLIKGIKFNLENEGYEVDVCYDGETAVEMALANDYNLILLDVMMPKQDGLQTCIKIRDTSTVPIIMLTARSEDSDKLVGFECGADDYITKPFNILELKARIRVLIRRSSIKTSVLGEDRITHNHITIDPERRIAEKSGVPVELTAKEFNLAELFIHNPGRVYSREMLLDLIWGVNYQGDIRTVDVHIRRLREKLELDPSNPKCFNTKWGVGYYFSEQ